jgi:hypothetical protein
MSGTQATQALDGRAGGDSAPAFLGILCAVDGKQAGFAAEEEAASLGAPGAHPTLLALTSFTSMGDHRAPAVGPMGSRGLHGLRANGSVSRRVVHEARCSVLLIPPERLRG